MQDLDPRPTIHIVLSNLNAIVPNWVRIAIRPNQQEWNVQGIEYYDSEGQAKRGTLDGFQGEQDFDPLPQAAKFAVWGWLNNWDHERRQVERNERLSETRYHKVLTVSAMAALATAVRT